jgi:hypothetical protein
MYIRTLETDATRKATHDELQKRIARERRQPQVTNRDKLIAKGLVKPATTQGA